jgi:hypothetical protein
MKINIGDNWKDVNSVKIKLDTNLLDYSDWIVGTGSTTNFTEYTRINVLYAHSINYRELGNDPFGGETVLWMTLGENTGYTAGILTQSNVGRPTIDVTKTYRYSIWVNRKTIGTTSPFYFGFYNYNGNSVISSIRTLDNAISTNFYFYSATQGTLLTVLPENTWRLVVGYMSPSTYTGGTNSEYFGRVYDLTGGTVASFNYHYKFSGTTTNTALRVYSPYNEATFSGVSSHFCYPRVDLVDGTEPSIATLLNNEGPWRTVSDIKVNVGDNWKNTS